MGVSLIVNNYPIGAVVMAFFGTREAIAMAFSSVVIYTKNLDYRYRI